LRLSLRNFDVFTVALSTYVGDNNGHAPFLHGTAANRDSSLAELDERGFETSGEFFRYTSCDVQNAQRRAAIATSLMHSGHFFVVGSGATSPRRMRAVSAFTGRTTKK
jgi:hypothetical protein